VEEFEEGVSINGEDVRERKGGERKGGVDSNKEIG